MTATAPPGVDVRACRLYRFYVEHPLTGEEVLGYIGETVRQPFERLMEHVDSQPWMDTVTRWERDPRVFAGKAAVLEAEAAAIRAERPLYNVRGNEGNAARIIPPVAIRQRRARDLQQDAPRWVHPDDRGPRARSMHSVPVRRKSITARLTPVQVKICLWSIAWLETTLTTATALHHWQYAGTWTQRWVIGSVTGLLLTAWSLTGAPVTKRQWRRVRRRGWKRALRW